MGVFLGWASESVTRRAVTAITHGEISPCDHGSKESSTRPKLQKGADRMCGSTVLFFSYRGKVYAEMTNNSDDRMHTVTRIERGQVLDVCDFSFHTTVSAMQ